MTTEQLIDGVVNAIFQEFGETTRIYTEQIEQGLDAPCFLVLAINPQKNRFLGRRYHRTCTINIIYFPGSQLASQMELRNVKFSFDDDGNLIVQHSPDIDRDVKFSLENGDAIATQSKQFDRVVDLTISRPEGDMAADSDLGQRIDKPTASNREINMVSERLFDCMEIIRANGHKIKGNNMEATAEDDTLVFTIDYDF